MENTFLVLPQKKRCSQNISYFLDRGIPSRVWIRCGDLGGCVHSVVHRLLTVVNKIAGCVVPQPKNRRVGRKDKNVYLIVLCRFSVFVSPVVSPNWVKIG